MIISLSGPDTFRSREQLKKIIAKFKADRDPKGLNVVRLDGEKEAAEKIWENIFASPFLAEKRLVVLENLLVSKQTDVMEEFSKRLEEQSMPSSAVLVFWEGTDKFKTKSAKELFEKIKKEKYSQSFAQLSGAKLFAWIEDEVKDHGGEIEREAVRFLEENAEGETWSLHSLLDQLVAYTRPESIKLDDVKLFLPAKADDNIFNLVDAIVKKEAKQVFLMIEEQYRQGKDAGYLFAMILRQFKIMLKLKDLAERQINPESVSKDLGLHPFVIKKTIPLTKTYSMAELRQVYEELLDIDIKIKTGQGDQRMLVEIFVGKLCLVKK